jgi:hypothetical protein
MVGDDYNLLPDRRRVLLASLAAVTGLPRPAITTTELSSMEQTGRSTHDSHSSAPKELARFAFLIGQWRFDARFKSESGEWETFHGTWTGRYILDGRAIADEYKMLGSGGDVAVHGMNFRVYDVATQVWNIKWLNALDGTWTDLTPEEFGGARFEEQSVSYIFREPMGATRGWTASYTRATYTSVSPTLFTWRGDKSNDRATWKEFMIVECHRVA